MITIKYKFETYNHFPYKVSAYDDGCFIEAKVSENSFKEARTELVGYLKKTFSRESPVVPASETYIDVTRIV